MFDRRANLSRQVEDEVRTHFGAQVFRTVIPRNVRLSEAPSHGKPILLYDIHSRGAVAYLELAEELLARHPRAQRKPPAAPASRGRARQQRRPDGRCEGTRSAAASTR